MERTIYDWDNDWALRHIPMKPSGVFFVTYIIGIIAIGAWKFFG